MVGNDLLVAGRSGGDVGGTDCNSVTATARFASQSEFLTDRRISLECETELDELSMRQQHQVGAFEGISFCVGCCSKEEGISLRARLGDTGPINLRTHLARPLVGNHHRRLGMR